MPMGIVEERVNKIMEQAYNLGIGIPVICLHPSEYRELQQEINTNNPYLRVPDQVNRSIFEYHGPFGDVKIEPSRDIPRFGRLSTAEFEDVRKKELQEKPLYKMLKEKISHRQQPSAQQPEERSE